MKKDLEIDYCDSCEIENCDECPLWWNDNILNESDILED